MSYVNKKIRVFKEAGDIEIRRKRSDGRMKTYQSATDARAWCDSTEDRRQYILDLVRQGDGKGLSLGKYIPIEAIIDILLANKNADIKRLQQEIERLKKFIADHGLTVPKKEPSAVAQPTERERAQAPETVVEVTEPETVEAAKITSPGDEEAGAPAGITGPDDKELGARTAEEVGATEDAAEERGQPEKTEVQAKTIDDDREDLPTGKQEGPEGVKYDSVNGKKSPLRRPITKEEEEAAQELLAGKSPDDQIEALRNALAEKEELYGLQHAIAAAAVEQLENIRNIVEDKDTGKNVRAKTPSLPPLKSSFTAPNRARDADACKDEIQALEREIAAMKSGSSPEKAVIQREVQVLKKYCAQLSAIQAENSELKKERDMYKDGLSSNADAALKDKLQKLDEVTQERDKLRARVQQLERELSNNDGVSQQAGSGSPMLDDLRGETEALKMRLENLQGLEDEVRKLKDRASKQVQPAGDSQEKDKLLARIAALEKELDNLRCALKEMEILRVEKNCLKMRLDDLAKVQQDYEELLKKTQGLDALKAECAMYKTEYEKLKALEGECNELRAKAQRAEDLENERRMLMKEIQDCECCMNNQDEEIKRLACHIDCLTQDLDKRQDQMKVKVLTLRAHLEKKDNIIVKSEQQLADVQDQLRNSIESLSCQTLCLRSRIEELEDEIKHYQKKVEEYESKSNERGSKIKEYEDKMRTSEKKMQDYEDAIKQYQTTLAMKEENNKMLLEKFENEKNTAAKLEEALKKAIVSDEHLKQMLKQAKCAIRCITQKLEKHDIVDLVQLEAERERYNKKIKELEDALCDLACGDGSDRSRELEQELKKANETIKILQESLENMKGLGEENERLRNLTNQLQEATKDQGKLKALIEENEVLRKLVAQLQESAKDNLSKHEEEILSKKSQVREEGDYRQLQEALAKKDQTIEELRKEIYALRQQVERERMLREDMEAAFSQFSPTGDTDAAEIGRLKAEINVLHAEIDRLHFELDNEKRRSLTLSEKVKPDLGSRVQELEAENAKLKTKIDDLTAGKDSQNTDCDILKKENEILKEEIEKLRSKTGVTDEISSSDKANLERENNDLKEEIKRLKQMLSEKESSDGADKYLNDKISKLKQELSSKENLDIENKNLKDQIEKLKAELTSKGDAGQEDKDLKDEISRLKQELANKEILEKENKDLKDQINKSQQELAVKDDLRGKDDNELKNEIIKLNEELAAKESLDKENKDLKHRINKLEQELASKENLDKDNKDLKDRLNKLEQELAIQGNLDNENKDLKDRINKLEQELVSKGDLDKENKDLKDRINKLEQEVASKENLDKENKDLKDQINKLKQELVPKEDASKGEEDLSNEINKLKKELSAKEKLVEDLKGELNNFKASSARDSGIKDEDFAKERDDLLNQIASQKKEIGELLEKIKEPASTEDDTVFKELQNRNKENEQLKATIADLEKQLKALQEASKGVDSEELQDKNKENQKLKDTIADLEKQLKDLQNTQLDAIPKESPEIDKVINDLRQSLEKEEQKNNELENSLKKCLEEGETLRKRISELETDKPSEAIKDMKADATSEDHKKRCQQLEAELAKQREECEEKLGALKNEYNKDITQEPETDEDYRKKCKQLEAELAKQKEECNKMIQSLREQYDRDIKSLRQQSEAAIDKLQKSQQEALDELNKQYDKETQDLKQQLRKSETNKKKIVVTNKVKANKSKPPEEKPRKEKVAEDEKPVQEKKTEVKPQQETVADEETPTEEKPREIEKPREAEKPREEEKPKEAEKTREEEKPMQELSQNEKPEERPKETIDPMTKADMKEEETPPEGKKEKKLSIKTFDEICICSRLPAVIPISPPVQAPSPPPSRPCICPVCPEFAGPEPRPLMPTTMAPMIHQPFAAQQPMAYGPDPRMMAQPPLTSPLDERMNSVMKLIELENKLLAKQKHTKEKIEELQNTVNKFKRELELEKQRNNDLVSRYTNQSKTVENMKLEMDIVKKENFQDKKKLHKLSMTLQNLVDGRGMMYPYTHSSGTFNILETRIPHFHTELNFLTDDNKYKHSCIMKKGTCSCNISSESFEIDE